MPKTNRPEWLWLNLGEMKAVYMFGRILRKMFEDLLHVDRVISLTPQIALAWVKDHSRQCYAPVFGS